jgi:hypothetical protein
MAQPNPLPSGGLLIGDLIARERQQAVVQASAR